MNESIKQRPFSGWLALLAWFTGLMVTLGVGALIMHADIQEAEKRFGARTDGLHQMLVQHFAGFDAVLTSLAGLYQGSEELDAAELTFIAQELLQRYEHIQSLGLLVWVSHADQASFEKFMGVQGFPAVRVHRLPDTGAGSDYSGHYHLALSFLEPMGPSAARYLGADALSDANLATAVRGAIDSGALGATRSAHFAKTGKGYLMFKATYLGRTAPDDISERRRQVSGAFFLALDLESISKEVATRYPGMGVAITPAEVDAVHPPNALLTQESESDLTPMVLPLPKFQATRIIDTNGHRLALSTTAVLRAGDLRLWLYALAMILTAVLIAGLGMMFRSRRRAYQTHKQSLETIFKERECAQVTLESISDAVITTDVEQRVKYMNPVAEQLTGRRNNEVAGRPLVDVLHLQHEQTEQPVSGSVLQSVGATHGTTRYQMIRNEGRPVGIDYRASPLRDQEGNRVGAVLVLRDVTKERQLTRQLAHQANHDSLTGLPNREFFQHKLTSTLSDAARLEQQTGVVMFDLDQFKLINDSLGHVAGDELLQLVAKRLKNSLRGNDTLARLGGDEFAAILPGIKNRKEASALTERAIASLRGPFQLGKTEVFITTSAGIASAPQNGTDIPELLKNADCACYHAKDQGRNGFQFYTAEINNRVTERLEIANHLRHAIERKELSVHYQPQLALKSGCIVGMEALARWHSAELGEVPPGRFIPVAEEIGLIGEIGEWVLREACRQNRSWRDSGYLPVRVSVNLSAHQFRVPSLAESVRDILAESKLDASGLTLEITETAIMHDMGGARDTLKTLNSMGIELAIDDFGTGYSSLGVLKQFSLNTLKIDRSFVRDIETDSNDREIVNAVITMAHSLNLKVVAEGVETAKQLYLLHANGCDEVQGYHLSKPLPANAAGRVLESNTRPNSPCADEDLQNRGPIVQHRQFGRRMLAS